MASLEQLVDRYLVEGDETAIEAVVRRTQRRLLRTARRITRDDADDCVQTAYLSLVHKRGAQLAAPVLPWLITAVVRIAYRHRAQQARRAAVVAHLGLVREGPDPVESAVQGEEARCLRRHVARLPQKLRDAVVLHALEGLSSKETGALLGISDAAVRVRVQRAKALLRTRIPRAAYMMLALGWLLSDAGARVRRTAKPSMGVVAVAAVPVLIALGWLAVGARRDEAAPIRVAAGAAAAPPPSAPGGVRAAGDLEPTSTEFVTGRVFDPDGAPVRRARVVSIPIDHRDPVRPGDTTGPVRATRTDDRGSFLVEVAGATYGWTLFVETEGLSPAMRRHVRPGDDVEVRLRPAASMSGSVMTSAGLPVAGAKLVRHSFWEGIHLTHRATSGSDGRYRFSVLPASDVFQVLAGAGDNAMLVSATGFASLTVSVPSPSPSDEFYFILTQGATVHGTVLDPVGKPMPDATVRLWSADFHRSLRVPAKGSMRHPLAGRLLQETKSAADGSYRFTGVPASGFHRQTMPEHCRLAARAPGLVSRAVDMPYAAPGETKEVSLRMVRTFDVRGRVVGRAGAARPGVDVRAFLPYRGFLWAASTTVRSRADGSFRIASLPEVARLHVGVGSSRFAVPSPTAGQTAVQLGALVVPERIQPSVGFLVVDGAGSPVWGAAVGDERTGRDGTCRVAWPDARAAVVTARGFARTVTDVIEPGADARVVMRSGCTLTGDVRWEDERPAADVWVFIYNGRVPLERAIDAREGKRTQELPPLVVYAAVRTSRDGRFRCDYLPDGPYHVTASHSTFGGGSVEARAPDVTDGVHLTLRGDRPVETSCHVHGTIRDARTGKPIPFFRAYVRHGTTPHPLWATKPGHWRRRGMAANKYRWWVEARGYPRYEGTFTVRPGQRELEVGIELDQGAVVRGVVRGAPPGSKIRLYERSWEFRDATIAADGTYEVPHLRPGRYLAEVHVMEKGRARRLALRGPRRITIGERRAEALDLEVVPGGEVDVVVKRQGLPRGAEVTIHQASGELVAGAIGSGVDRRMGWAKSGWSQWLLTPGRYVVRFVCPGSETSERTFQVVAGTRQVIELGEKS